MRTTAIALTLLFLVLGHCLGQGVDADFVVTADGNDEYQGEAIHVPDIRLTGSGAGTFGYTAPPISTTLDANTAYTADVAEEVGGVTTDRITLDKLYKHHVWDNDLEEHLLYHDFTTPSSQYTLEKQADFKSVLSVELYNNFEEFNDAGTLKFRDPWYVDASGNQPDQLTQFESVLRPTGNYGYDGGNGTSSPGIFGGQTVQTGKPYYSLQYRPLLDADYQTTATEPLDRGDWSLIGVYPRSPADAVVEDSNQRWSSSGGTWSRNTSLYDVDVRFDANNAEVFGFYKAHMKATQDVPPTQGNSQRRIVRESRTGQDFYHAVYVSGGRIYYTWTEDDGSTWKPEVLISDFHHAASKPGIAIRQEQSSASINECLFVSYVDETDAEIVLKRRFLPLNPENWSVIDEIELWDHTIAHPVLATGSRGDRDNCVLVWEDSLSLKYAVYSGSLPITGDRVTSQGTSSGVTFDELTLADGYYSAWRRTYYQPEMPSVVAEAGCNGASFAFPLVWREGDLGSMRCKTLLVEYDTVSQSWTVTDPDPIFVPSNRLYIDDHAAPSIASACASGHTWIAYEFKNQGIFPTPSRIPSAGISLLGRTFTPVTSRYPNVSVGGSSVIVPADRVAVLAGLRNYPTAWRWKHVTRVLNAPANLATRPEPTIGWDGAGVMLAMNYRLFPRAIVSVKYPFSAPATVNATVQTDGLYPSMTHAGTALEIYSSFDQSAASLPPSSPVLGHWLKYDVMQTSSSLRKTAQITTSDMLRELILRKNDSSYALFGVVKPHVMNADSQFTALTWDLSADTSDIFYWDQLPKCIRTTSFVVPTGGIVEYGNELFARNTADLDSSAIVLLQFRDASSHVLLYEASINMADYQGDTALYVLDRHDLTAHAGSSVYMCLDVQDTASADSWEVQVITSIDTVQQQKRSTAGHVVPSTVHLHQNVPNPFNPSTTITYELAVDLPVRLQVFDQFGRCVATLDESSKSAGMHTVTFNARNLPSGVYYCRLRAGDQVRSRKMLFVK